MTNVLLQQAKAAAAAGTVKDQSVKETGFKRQITPAGVTTARFVGYVEIGDHPQDPYKGKAKPDAPMVRLTFELNGPAYLKDVSKEGEPAKIIPTLHTEELKISSNEKAKYWKLFQKMVGAGDTKNLSELLGSAYIITIKHEKGVKDATKTYAKMYTQVDGWLIGPPTETSASTGLVSDVPVPAIIGDPSLLLWEAPTAEQWASLFIDGTYDKTVNGVETKVSKNFIQFKALGATDFATSPLKTLLDTTGTLAALTAEAAASNAAYGNKAPAPEADTPAADTAPAVMPTDDTPPEEQAPTPEAAPQDTPPVSEQDALANLGLTT